MSSRDPSSVGRFGASQAHGYSGVGPNPSDQLRALKPQEQLRVTESAPLRVLPPLGQHPLNRPGVIQRQPHGGTPQPIYWQGNQYQTPSPLVTSPASLSSDVSYQNRPASFPVPARRGFPPGPPVQTRNSATSSSQSPASDYQNFHGFPGSIVYVGSHPGSLDGSARLNTRHSPQHGSSGSGTSSITSASPYDPLNPQPKHAVPDAVQNHDRTSDITDRYQLFVRQQPLGARACGFGERDRRVIDPPPIIQLTLADYNPKSPADVSELKYAQLVVQCTLILVSATGLTGRSGDDVTTVAEPTHPGKMTRKMTGTLVASPFCGTDPEIPVYHDRNARLGCFFIFPDISCRQVGRYRLKFSIFKVELPPPTPGFVIPVLASIESNVFEVYSAKDFPGMKASTSLIKDLKRQGAPVSIKKGKEGRTSRRGQQDSGSSGNDDEGNEEIDPRDAVLRSVERKARR